MSSARILALGAASHLASCLAGPPSCHVDVASIIVFAIILIITVVIAVVSALPSSSLPWPSSSSLLLLPGCTP